MSDAPPRPPAEELLLALQMGDSAYPTGSFGYSWGLETLLAEGLVTRASLPLFAEAELEGRWHRIERIALAGGWRAEDVAALEAWDALIDQYLWSEHQRIHSHEAGAATLAAATRLSLPGAAALREGVAAGRMAGHFPVVTGALYRAAGLRLGTALLLSAQVFLRGLLSVAVRLGLAGALEVQAIMARLVSPLARLAAPPPPDARPCGFSPLTEIAQMRLRDTRLFVN
ncbi:urease accessory protein UreF [Pseudodonghicola flavimaris]|uniref:Urease accessory UreF family protein n=1 Tax=Pseudodonghicola flavimaris TaxID=3050036 RepID=A0ABT7F1R8_9RHOB|nr:urease accessory UreF family protein [Pseudodonghicola flavimaris]MDK3018544.1 urease accessory UreF family protein [Pseudodonghicola flavimaris]